MMKTVFALVVLLHLCYTADLDMNMNDVIQNGLKELKSKEVHFMTPGLVKVPALNKSISLSSCVGLFTKLLKELLNNVTVDGHENLLTNLKENLEHLGPHVKFDPKCKTEEIKQNSLVFKKFINFLKKLNDAKER